MLPHLICIAFLLLVAFSFRWLIKERKAAKDFIKKLDEAHHKEGTATYLDPHDIPGKQWDDLDIFECQRPHIEYRAGCN